MNLFSWKRPVETQISQKAPLSWWICRPCMKNTVGSNPMLVVYNQPSWCRVYSSQDFHFQLSVRGSNVCPEAYRFSPKIHVCDYFPNEDLFWNTVRHLYRQAFPSASVVVCKQSVFLVTCDHYCVVSVCKLLPSSDAGIVKNVFFFCSSLWLTGATVRHFTVPIMTKPCINTVATPSQKTTNPQKKQQPALLSASAWSGIHQRALVDVIDSMSIYFSRLFGILDSKTWCWIY